MKIFLTGFMGSGKSLLGKMLAEKLDLAFLDLDAFLEEMAGHSISEIFSRQGEKAFRTLEAEALRHTAPMERTVIATGGGTPCYHQNMEWMNDHGVSIFLDVSTDLLSTRLQADLGLRPLIAGKTEEELAGFINTKLAARRVFYEQSHFVCHANDSADELVDSITGYFSRFLRKA